jgi:hypothetical protein
VVALFDVLGCGRATPRWVLCVVVFHSSLNNLGWCCSSLVEYGMVQNGSVEKVGRWTAAEAPLASA